MITINLNKLDLVEFIGNNDPMQHCKATFPLIGAHGSKKLATVYFEIEPGHSLGKHTDNAEELIIIIDGTLEAEIGIEKGMVTRGDITLIPEMVPHDFKNVGEQRARVLGVFGGKNNIIATFENEWLPTHSNVVDTALIG